MSRKSADVEAPDEDQEEQEQVTLLGKSPSPSGVLPERRSAFIKVTYAWLTMQLGVFFALLIWLRNDTLSREAVTDFLPLLGLVAFVLFVTYLVLRYCAPAYDPYAQWVLLAYCLLSQFPIAIALSSYTDTSQCLLVVLVTIAVFSSASLGAYFAPVSALNSLLTMANTALWIFLVVYIINCWFLVPAGYTVLQLPFCILGVVCFSMVVFLFTELILMVPPMQDKYGEPRLAVFTGLEASCILFILFSGIFSAIDGIVSYCYGGKAASKFGTFSE
eukprot:gnl/Spiro4/4209_TR2104_c0_g1_i1.p1 gnl/Spiro4/4209_TR2104_c0_g1~~gnl/Spiro4/4209_TR2104_c0_g1_i1.p1  ORF type:complete len:275 (-),score=54.72 gnl/Spiro4/4209_TR2104_c0_g1_i1:58-882(-)